MSRPATSKIPQTLWKLKGQENVIESYESSGTKPYLARKIIEKKQNLRSEPGSGSSTGETRDEIEGQNEEGRGGWKAKA